MSLSDRIDKIKIMLYPDEIPNVHVITVYSHQSKDEAIQEYEQINNIKTSVKDKFVYVQILPDDDKQKCDFKQTEFFRIYKKQIDELFRNKGYSMDKILNEYLESGF